MAFHYCGIVWERRTVSALLTASFFSATSIENPWKKWIDEWIEGEGRYWSCFMSLAVWVARLRRGAATSAFFFVHRSSIIALMSKVTINLSIKSKTNKRQKMMHRSNAAPSLCSRHKQKQRQPNRSERSTHRPYCKRGLNGVGGLWC